MFYPAWLNQEKSFCIDISDIWTITTFVFPQELVRVFLMGRSSPNFPTFLDLYCSHFDINQLKIGAILIPRRKNIPDGGWAWFIPITDGADEPAHGFEIGEEPRRNWAFLLILHEFDNYHPIVMLPYDLVPVGSAYDSYDLGEHKFRTSDQDSNSVSLNRDPDIRESKGLNMML